MLAGKKWIRNGRVWSGRLTPALRDEAKGEDLLVAWSPKPYAYVRVRNTEKGSLFYDLYGTQRFGRTTRSAPAACPSHWAQAPFTSWARRHQANARPDPGGKT